jgi:HlyD family secretion protein
MSKNETRNGKSTSSFIKCQTKEVSHSARIEQIDQAKGQLDRAVGAKEEVLSAESEKYLIAPTNMTIETISLQVGELLTLVLHCSMDMKSSLYFRFTVPESKIYDFKVGKR